MSELPEHVARNRMYWNRQLRGTAPDRPRAPAPVLARVPLLHGNAEEVPYPDESFDLAISEYGASLWCDPYRWIPEAARLLRPAASATGA